MEALCSASWPKLVTLQLGNNLITTASLEGLRNTDWADLRELSVRTPPSTQRRTPSGTRAWRPSCRDLGRTCAS
jgi:hypothetical protein